MELKNRTWNLRSYRTLDHLFQDRGFVFAAYQYKDPVAAHNIADAHGIRLTGNILFSVKEALICLDGLLCKIHTVCTCLKMI